MNIFLLELMGIARNWIWMSLPDSRGVLGANSSVSDVLEPMVQPIFYYLKKHVSVNFAAHAGRPVAASMSLSIIANVLCLICSRPAMPQEPSEATIVSCNTFISSKPMAPCSATIS